MTDTTDQQAVTVAQDVTNLCRIMAKADGLDWDEVCPYENDCAENLGDVACDSGTCVAAHYEDHDVDVARGRYIGLAKAVLASVSSASAETPERKETLSERQAREVMNPGFGSAVGRSDGTAWNAAASNLQKAQVAPEPVPATNQAGEVREALARELASERNDSDEAQHDACGTTPWDGTDDDYMPEALAFVDRCAALATQPATSQEGNQSETPISSIAATSQEGEDVTAMVKALKWYEEMVGNCRKLTPTGDVARAALDFDGGKIATDALAATPTPPTLSEDLREAAQAVVDDYPVAAGMYTSLEGTDGKPGYGSIRRLAAALAQVKAS